MVDGRRRGVGKRGAGMGLREDGEQLTTFRGASWSVFPINPDIIVIQARVVDQADHCAAHTTFYLTPTEARELGHCLIFEGNKQRKVNTDDV
jgi:hypothetical protein